MQQSTTACKYFVWLETRNEVINVGGYIGSSTRSEIEYAIATGKAVRYLELEEA